jgi:predicted RNA binding protein YcfA (HicA-like mRNA interferase family)
VPKLPGINHLDAVRAFEKAGFGVVRQGKHIVMTDGVRILTIPRHNPVNALTMGGIVRDAGLTVEQFRKLTRACSRRAGGRGVPRGRHPPMVPLRNEGPCGHGHDRPQRMRKSLGGRTGIVFLQGDRADGI